MRRSYSPNSVDLMKSNPNPVQETDVLTKQIKAFGEALEIRCDGKCSKAWGVNNRPQEHFDPADPDDYAFLADQEIEGDAPRDPGTYEGGHGKPSGEDLTDPARMNKWCFRECERCVEAPRMPHDFSTRLFNIPSRHAQA